MCGDDVDSSTPLVVIMRLVDGGCGGLLGGGDGSCRGTLLRYKPELQARYLLLGFYGLSRFYQSKLSPLEGHAHPRALP